MNSGKLTTRSAPRAKSLTERAAWKALAEHCQTARGLHLRQLFAEDPHRGERLSTERPERHVSSSPTDHAHDLELAEDLRREGKWTFWKSESAARACLELKREVLKEINRNVG